MTTYPSPRPTRWSRISWPRSNSNLPPTRKRLIFAIDATACRQPTWDLACQVQAQMFLETGRYGGIDVQLVYFRGFNEMKATKFFG